MKSFGVVLLSKPSLRKGGDKLENHSGVQKDQ